MRVTELTKHNAVNGNLNRTSEKLQDLLIGVSSGKKLNKPSDDPVGAAKVQDFQTSINHSKTLERNIIADKVWLSTSEETIAQISEILMHLKRLALEGANGASTVEHRESLAKEIELITRNLINLGNKREGKLFVFSGTKTFTQPLEIQSEIEAAAVSFLGTRLKSSEKIIPLNHDKPLPGLQPGSFTIHFVHSMPPDENAVNGSNTGETLTAPAEASDESETPPPPPNQITIELQGEESLRDIVKMINDAAIAEQEYQEDPHSPIGFKANVIAEIGNDHATYLDPASGVQIRFGEDTAGFFQAMGFGIIGDPSGYAMTADDAGPPLLTDEAIDPAVYQAQFNGYSKQPYLVRVIKGGGYGVAQYSVSDDGGESWSKAALLQKQNEIFNPEGKASSKVMLQFGQPGNLYFREGLEFRFDGNEFVTYNGNEQVKEVIIDNGIKVALNINAKQLFFDEQGDAETVNTFDVLNRLTAALRDDDEMAVQKSIDELNIGLNQVLDKRSQIGSTFKELENSEGRIQASMDFKAAERSKIEDMDLAKGAVDLNAAELKHKVALDSSARLIQPTLINFLR